MNRSCEIAQCFNYARPNRRTCTTHRSIPARLGPAIEPDLTEIDFAVRERCSIAGLERQEQIIAVARLLDGGVPEDEVARLAGVSTRTVWRWLAQDRQAA